MCDTATQYEKAAELARCSATAERRYADAIAQLNAWHPEDNDTAMLAYDASAAADKADEAASTATEAAWRKEDLSKLATA